MNDLSVTKSLAQLLQSSETLAPFEREDISSIHGMITHATDLCSQMQAELAGRVAPSALRQEVDLNLLLNACRSTLKAGLGDGIELELDMRENLPTIEASESQLREVLFELVKNAARATEAKLPECRSRITISTGLHDAMLTCMDSCVTYGEEVATDHVFLEVADSGCGMSEESMNRLFQPHFTTRVDGQGLGMCSILRIIKEHGGAIVVSSSVDQGTVMRCLFPRDASSKS